MITNERISAMIRRKFKSNKVQKYEKHGNTMKKFNEREEDMMLEDYGKICWFN